MSTSNPYKIKSPGSNVRNFEQIRWQQECEHEVLNITLAKFRQNNDLKEYPLNTGSRRIIEATKDQFWGGGRLLNDIDVLDVQMNMGKKM